MATRKAKTVPLIVDDRDDETHVDPYSPTSPDYAERHRVTRYEILPGIWLESIGGPTA